MTDAVSSSLCAFSAAARVITASIDTLGEPSGDAASSEKSRKRRSSASSTGVRAFVSLKAAGRGACLAISGVRDVVAARKVALDGRHLELHNLLYRNHRLRDEVKSCRNFKCKALAKILREDKEAEFGGASSEEQGDFASLFDSEEQGGGGNPSGGGVADDENAHLMRLGALEAELAARKAAALAREASLKQKVALEATIEADAATLDKLPQLLSALSSAMTPLREALLTDEPSAKRVRLNPETQNRIDALPRPLYLIYSQLDACHRSVFEEASTVEVVTRQKKSQEEEEDDAPCLSSEHSVVLTLEGDDSSVTRIAFDYDRVVTVESWRDGERHPNLLESMFPPQEAVTDAAAAAAAADLGHARSYDWAQWIAGLGADDSSRRRLEPSVRLVCAAINGRLAARDALEAQLTDLSKRPPPHPGGENKKKSGGSRLISLTPSSNSQKNRHFTAHFQQQHTKATLCAEIEIQPDYPTTPPRFRLRHTSSSSSSTKKTTSTVAAPFETSLNDVEGAVNLHCEDGYWLLSSQLRKLLECLDTLADDKTGDSTFGRARRGRDRRLPLASNYPRAKKQQ